MDEYWQITHLRGIKTLAVWYMQAAFQITGATMAQHTTRVNSLPTLAAARDEFQADLSDERQARDNFFEKLYNLNTRVAPTIDGLITDDNDLHGQLDLVYAAGHSKAQSSVLRRARLVAGLWADYNTQLAAETPARPPLEMKYAVPGGIEPAEDVLQADFVALIASALAAQQAEANAQRDLSDARSELRAADRRVDRDNKRWYLAWTKQFPEGTPEGDTARSEIPTEQGTPAPTPLQIESAVVQPGNTVLVTFGTGGQHATTKELLYKLDSEADYGHTQPITGLNQFAGPFPAETTVTFITRVANSTAGFVMGNPVAAVIPT
jgi:hypothetical protein